MKVEAAGAPRAFVRYDRRTAQRSRRLLRNRPSVAHHFVIPMITERIASGFIDCLHDATAAEIALERVELRTHLRDADPQPHRDGARRMAGRS
ncbi:hypothetical protein ACV229_35970 [Burkholderia sp. MR1-5-21]